MSKLTGICFILLIPFVLWLTHGVLKADKDLTLCEDAEKSGLKILWHTDCYKGEEDFKPIEPCSTSLVIKDVIAQKIYPIGLEYQTSACSGRECAQLLFVLSEKNEKEILVKGNYVYAQETKE